MIEIISFIRQVVVLRSSMIPAISIKADDARLGRDAYINREYKMGDDNYTYCNGYAAEFWCWFCVNMSFARMRNSAVFTG